VEGTKGEPRIMATAKITLKNGHAIRFASTHLDAQSNPINREKQMTEIVAIRSAEQLPFIIAGDLNAQPGSREINILDEKFTRTCTECQATFPVVKPRAAIDFIAFSTSSRIKVLSHTVVQEHYASDHLPIVALLQIAF
jgi:endonuclease/exonuclease/phosphatase family metal-dependent hydrolase